MRDHSHTGNFIFRYAMQIISALALCAAIAASGAQPAGAQIIDDGRRAYETLTPALAGTHNLQSSESWYRVDLAGMHVGFVHIAVQASGGKVVYKEQVRIKQSAYYDNMDFEVTLAQGSLKPNKAVVYKEGRYYKAYRKIHKTYVFDWDARKIVIISGDGANARSRSVAMQPNAVYTPHWFFALHKRELLKPGAEYRFQTFDFDLERFITLGVTVLAETKKDVFELFWDLPEAYGTSVDMRFWVSPKTIANPNGDFLRKEWIGEFMNEPLTMVKSTKEKATRQETDKKPSKKK